MSSVSCESFDTSLSVLSVQVRPMQSNVSSRYRSPSSLELELKLESLLPIPDACIKLVLLTSDSRGQTSINFYSCLLAGTMAWESMHQFNVDLSASMN